MNQERRQHPDTEAAGAAAAATGIDIMNALPDPAFLLAAGGELLAANRRGTEFLAGAGTFQVLLSGHDVELFRRTLSQVLGDTLPRTIEASIRAAGRPPMPYELSLGAVAANPVRLLLTVRDISAQKRQELDLLRFSNLAHHTVNPIEITDLRGKIIYVNPAFEKASGFRREELIGRNPSVFGSGKHSRAFWERMWNTITSGKVWVGEVINRRRNGEPFYTDLLISPIVDAAGGIIGFFGIHRDMSAQRQLEHRLQEAQKMESIGMLAAGIAHEVGNPLTSISSLVQLIQRSTAEAATQERMELIKGQVTRISRIIRDLVDFSRRSTYELRLTDLNRKMRDAVEIVRLGRKARDITFDVSLAGDLPQLHVVPDQIEQVFINLLINAVDAIAGPGQPDAGAAPEPPPAARTITIRSGDADGWAFFTVSDTGSGIPEEDLPKIFEPFFTTKGPGEGTGLGLWVSYGIIRSFHGEITADSAPGKGTLFTVRLPLQSSYAQQ